MVNKRRFPYFKVLIVVIALPTLWYVYLYVVRPLIVVIAILIHRAGTEELERLESPDHAIVAVAVQSDAGATEPFGYDVYLAKNGSSNLGDRVFEASGGAIKLKWVSSKLLEISYTDDCIGFFHNHWSTQKLEAGHYDVEIRLKPPEDSKHHDCG